MLVWAYLVDANGIKDITDQNGNKVGEPIQGRIYYCDSSHPELGKKLFHSASGVLYPDEIDAVVKAYVPAAVVKPKAPTPKPSNDEPEKPKKKKKKAKKDN